MVVKSNAYSNQYAFYLVDHHIILIFAFMELNSHSDLAFAHILKDFCYFIRFGCALLYVNVLYEAFAQPWSV